MLMALKDKEMSVCGVDPSGGFIDFVRSNGIECFHSLDDMKKAATMGAKMELCAAGPLMGPQAHLPWMRAWRQVRIQESAEAIQTIGAEHFVLGTDLGQSGNPSHADGLQMFVAELMAQGLSKEQIKIAGGEVAARLLMG